MAEKEAYRQTSEEVISQFNTDTAKDLVTELEELKTDQMESKRVNTHHFTKIHCSV